MGSIRPLVTITILVVVGAYLYVKINEGPMQTHAGANNAASQTPEGVPPLTTTKGASLASESGAPAWPPTASAVMPPAASSLPPLASTSGSTTPAAGTSKDSVPSVPPIPELPELPPATIGAAPAPQPGMSLPKDLPANIPSARYPDEPGKNATNGGPKDGLNLPAPLTTSVSESGKTTDSVSATFPPITAPLLNSPPAPAQSPTPNSAMPQLAPGLGTSPPLSPTAPSAAQNPLRTAGAPSTTAPAEPDRYGTASSPPAGLTPATTAPNQSIAPSRNELSFAAGWPTIQAALDRGDLKQAHQLLSKWHGNESLSPAEAERVETLLGQLAGSVIYSTDHQLEPARIAKPGETLETIAKEYNVPWQLLGKINGIGSPEQLRPGQELKVVRGPFSAVVDLHRSEVTLLIEERYAGKFHVTLPPGATLTDGQWVVDQKLIGPPSTANPTAYATTPVPGDRTIILRNAAAGSSLAGSPTLIIASGSSPIGVASNPPALHVSAQDAEELSDILSVGSRVTVRR